MFLFTWTGFSLFGEKTPSPLRIQFFPFRGKISYWVKSPVIVIQGNFPERWWIAPALPYRHILTPIHSCENFFPSPALMHQHVSGSTLSPFYRWRNWGPARMLLFVAFCFLGPHPQHMEFPRLGVLSELQLPAYTTATAMPDPSCVCNLHHSSQQQ